MIKFWESVKSRVFEILVPNNGYIWNYDGYDLHRSS